MTRTAHHWPSIIADLKEHEGRWRLHPSLAATPRRVAKTIRLRQTQALHDLSGVLEIAVFNEWRDERGRMVADIYLRWKPR